VSWFAKFFTIVGVLVGCLQRPLSKNRRRDSNQTASDIPGAVQRCPSSSTSLFYGSHNAILEHKLSPESHQKKQGNHFFSSIFPDTTEYILTLFS
jgi:hypothetical protein